MYLHLCPLPLYEYSGCIHAPLVPIHENIFGELILLRIHAAHVFAPGRIQENIPGEFFMYWFLSGPLNRLNAILSLLHPLDRYRTHSAIGSAIGRPLSRPISHPNTGGSPQLPRSKPLRGLNRAIVALYCPKPH